MLSNESKVQNYFLRWGRHNILLFKFQKISNPEHTQNKSNLIESDHIYSKSIDFFFEIPTNLRSCVYPLEYFMT